MKADKLEELLRYRLGLGKVWVRNNNLMACCPAHEERRPSWGISMSEPHLHGCFSCGYKGSLRSLLLDKGLTLTEVNDLLGEKSYDDLPRWVADDNPDKVTLESVDEQNLWPYELAEPAKRYLLKRGISLSTMRRAGILWDRLNERVLFPWRYHGKLLGATGRAIRVTDEAEGRKMIGYFGLKKSKALYVPLGKLKPAKPVILVEGEIDALAMLETGMTNVAALGHGRFSQGAAALLRSLPVKTLIVFMDNDEAGERLTADVCESMESDTQVKVVSYDILTNRKLDAKLDPGSLTGFEIREMILRAKRRCNWSRFSS